MEKVTFTVTGMTCNGCENSVITKLKEVDGVLSATADHTQERVSVEFDPLKTNPLFLTMTINATPFSVVE